MRKLMKGRLGKAWGLVAALVAAGSIWLAQSGCLTPAQREAFADNTATSDRGAALVIQYQDEIGQVRGWIADGKVDSAEGLALIARIAADKDEALAVVAEARDNLAALKAAESPWWLYVLAAASTVLGVGGPLVGGRAAAVANTGRAVIGAAFGTLSRAVEEGPQEGEKMSTAIGRKADQDGTRAELERLRLKAAIREI